MPFLRSLARVTFHVAVALALVLFTLYLLYPDTLAAARNAANNFIYSIKTKLQQLPINKIIQGTSLITRNAFGVCRKLVSSLYSKGAIFLHALQTLSWLDIMNEVDICVQSLMDWFSALKEVISKASGSTLGRFAILAASVFIFNNLLALVGTIRTLWGIVFYTVHLAWKTVAFIVRLLWDMAAFIVRLFYGLVP